MPVNPPTTSTLSVLGTYLNHWVKIASGDRVKLSGGMNFSGTYSNTGYFIFKCEQCKDNWHVGHENFFGNVNDPAAQTIPWVLSDWVKKHRHVCKKYKLASHLNCAECRWPYGAHEESWNTTLMTHATTSPQSAGESMTLKQFTGRKFREVECESPDTITDKTSNG